MRRQKRTSGLLRRFQAILLAAGTLWTVGVTAGSDSAPTAAAAVRDALAETALHLSGVPGDGSLSPPAALALGQSPLLYSAGDGALWRHAGEGLPDDEPEANPAGDSEPDSEPADSGETGTPDTSETADTPATPDAATPDAAVAENTGTVETPEQPDETGGARVPVPLEEEPVEPAAPVDNGMKARTLVPTGDSGYTVVGRVYISSSRSGALDVSALTDTFDAALTGGSPEILILHSHGSEAYTPVPGTEVVWSGDHRTTDPRYSVVKVGDVMAEVFSEAGISVLHDRTLYDYPDYTGSYDRSLAAINSYLTQYPSIHFILDVHRDSIADAAGNQYKVISEIEGVGTAAQLTLVMGSDGSGASHPKWMENLKLAVAIQEQALSKYPTLMRPILLRKSRYNQHATTGSLLVEVGASGNSPEEAQLAARLFAEEMTEVLAARTK